MRPRPCTMSSVGRTARVRVSNLEWRAQITRLQPSKIWEHAQITRPWVSPSSHTATDGCTTPSQPVTELEKSGMTNELDTCTTLCVAPEPVLELSFSAIKQFDFSWAAVPGAEFYQLLESPALGEPFVQIGEDIVGESISITMPLRPPARHDCRESEQREPWLRLALPTPPSRLSLLVVHRVAPDEGLLPPGGRADVAVRAVEYADRTLVARAGLDVPAVAPHKRGDAPR
jgi:hypothetical protein